MDKPNATNIAQKMVTIFLIIFCLAAVVLILVKIAKKRVEYIRNGYPRAYNQFVYDNDIEICGKDRYSVLFKIGFRCESLWKADEEQIKKKEKLHLNNLKKQKDEIANKYPLAFKVFVVSNNINPNTTNVYDLQKITRRTTVYWEKEEKDLVEKKRVNNERQSNSNQIISSSIQKSLEKWKIEEFERRRKEQEEQEKKKFEDEKRKAAEAQQYKPEKDKILNLLRMNGITFFYHFTAASNIDSIKHNGGLYSWWSLDQKKLKVPFRGGEGIGYVLDQRYALQDYVRLSFCDDHPMAYKFKQQGIKLVLLKIDIEVATWNDTLFSDRNATDNSHHHGGRYEDLTKVDFDAVKMHYVRRDDPEFKPHQAEVMVKSFMPLKYIKNIDSPLYM